MVAQKPLKKAANSVLGKLRKSFLPSPDSLEFLKRQIASSDPVKAAVAREAVAPHPILIGDAINPPAPPACPPEPELVWVSEGKPPFRRWQIAKPSSAPVVSTRTVEELRQMKLRGPRCRYCGAASIYPWGAQQRCGRCDKLCNRIEAATMAGHSIADRRGWTWPATIGDDELYRRVIAKITSGEKNAVEAKPRDKIKSARLKRQDDYREAAE
jgi:hypothetical protein